MIVLFALLGELRPVRCDALLVVEPAARVGDRQGHRGQALGCRVDQDHRVLFPRLAGRLVPHTAPQVDDLLAAVVHAASAAQLVAPREILDERIAHGIKAATDMSLETRHRYGSQFPLVMAYSMRGALPEAPPSMPRRQRVGARPPIADALREVVLRVGEGDGRG